jgi:hypothetical protein
LSSTHRDRAGWPAAGIAKIIREISSEAFIATPPA